jgi:hypothetical protein
VEKEHRELVMNQRDSLNGKKWEEAQNRGDLSKLLYLLTMLTLLPTAANAGPDLPRPLAAPELPSLKQLMEKASRQLIMPPFEYDKPFEGKLIVTEVPNKEEVRIECGLPEPKLACAFPRPHKNECEIIVAPEEHILRDGYLPAIVMRHEIGHCNGWSEKHEHSRVPTSEELFAIARTMAAKGLSEK